MHLQGFFPYLGPSSHRLYRTRPGPWDTTSRQRLFLADEVDRGTRRPYPDLRAVLGSTRSRDCLRWEGAYNEGPEEARIPSTELPKYRSSRLLLRSMVRSAGYAPFMMRAVEGVSSMACRLSSMRSSTIAWSSIPPLCRRPCESPLGLKRSSASGNRRSWPCNTRIDRCTECSSIRR